MNNLDYFLCLMGLGSIITIAMFGLYKFMDFFNTIDEIKRDVKKCLKRIK